MDKIQGEREWRHRVRTKKEPVCFIPVSSLCTQLSLAQRPQQLITCRHITDTCDDLCGPLWRCTTLIGQVQDTKEKQSWVVLLHKRQIS